MFVSGSREDFVRAVEGRLLQDGYHPRPKSFYATLRPLDRKIIRTRTTKSEEEKREFLKNILPRV